ncbi:MAG: ABC-F family ATP-binding cassette domain-containing protein [Pseudomonadota bacterium]
MARPPLLTLTDVALTFGGKPLFTGVSLSLAKGERAALVGRNGAGKSTLMKLMSGALEPDGGDIWLQAGAVTAIVPQEPDFSGYDTALAYAGEGLDERHFAEAELTEMGIDPTLDPATLSGGQARRVALARAFARQPDLLMMDEPTNHLDIATIAMLETRLNAFKGALILVSHDRRFLENVSTTVLWLRQGVVLKSPGGYGKFDDWADGVEAAEEKRLARMQTQLKAEHRWLARGVTGRRRRNQGRLTKLMEMRARHADLRAGLAAGRAGADLAAESGDVLSKRVIEAKSLHKTYETPTGPLPIVTDLTLNILRGDRIGIVGPNGAGKTTLIKLLLGELDADSGRLKRNPTIEPTYLDQARDALNPRDTLWETLAPSGGDQIMVQGTPRHVTGYAKDFLFLPEQMRQPVGALSGGERNRLTMAVALARPSNLLVMDEPTNDLDMQTLDLLEDMLASYDGTLIIVSHDRAFLDATVTSCLVPVGGGQWLQTAGGWSDALEQVPSLLGAAPRPKAAKSPAKPKPDRSAKTQTKLSYKDSYRLEELGTLMPEREAEIAELEAALAAPDAYGKDPAAFTAKSQRLEAAQADLATMEEEWLTLEEKREALTSGA